MKALDFDANIVPLINNSVELDSDHLQLQACPLKWHKIQDTKSCLILSYIK